jgi:hypothetical protein
VAHAYGLNNRGVSDDDLLRLYNPSDKNALTDLLASGRSHEKSLDLSKGQIKAAMILLPM